MSYVCEMTHRKSTGVRGGRTAAGTGVCGILVTANFYDSALAESAKCYPERSGWRSSAGPQDHALAAHTAHTTQLSDACGCALALAHVRAVRLRM